MSDLAHYDISRRSLLKGGLVALASGPLLAACGVNTSGLKQAPFRYTTS